MANWDSTDLLGRFLRKSGVPAVRSFPLDGDIYAWLTEANVHWHNVIAQHAPWSQYGEPVQLTTSDGGLTYDFPAGVFPIGSIEVYDTYPRGKLLTPGAFWDHNADYVFEGSKIRAPRGVERQYSDGPYARYMADAGEISASVEPTLTPPSVNQLLVETACAIWAERGGMKDPAPFERAANRLWLGDAGVTNWGILGMLKTANTFQGMEAFSQPDMSVLGNIDTGAGYTPI